MTNPEPKRAAAVSLYGRGRRQTLVYPLLAQSVAARIAEYTVELLLQVSPGFGFIINFLADMYCYQTRHTLASCKVS